MVRNSSAYSASDVRSRAHALRSKISKPLALYQPTLALRGPLQLRIDFGPGYRLYFAQRGKVLIILLCGGDKSTQARDIRKAKALAADL